MPARALASVSCQSRDDRVREVARCAAEAAGAPLLASGDAPYGVTVVFGDEAVTLHEGSPRAGRGFRVDLTAIDHRTGSGNLSRRQPLARALGRGTRTVVDATAGFGHDACLLALMGYEVTALERSPLVHALLADGVRRALADASFTAALGGRLEVVLADARSWLVDLRDPPDAIYLDPMYPLPMRRRSALSKKTPRLLRSLVGDDEDSVQLIAIARGVVRRRVVVKRPLHADALNPDVDRSLSGKMVRYDVYLSTRVAR